VTAAMLVVMVCTAALGGALAVDVTRGRRGGSTTRSTTATTVGAEVPTRSVVGTTPGGRRLTVELDGPGRRTLVGFLTSTCVTCRGLWAEFGDDLASRLPQGTGVVIVTEDAAAERVAAVRDLAPRGVPVVMSSATWREFGVGAAPYFVLLDGTTGRILAADTAADGDAVVRLVRSAAGD
jgi:hypothetical protein